MKYCNGCKEEKSLSDFNFKNKEKGTYGSYCRQCCHLYTRKHYVENKKYYKDKAGRARERKKGYIRTKKERPCMDCGGIFPYYVMDFDHRDMGTKVKEMNKMYNESWEAIAEELKKCDVVCANCHRMRTYRRITSVAQLDRAVAFEAKGL